MKTELTKEEWMLVKPFINAVLAASAQGVTVKIATCPAEKAALAKLFIYAHEQTNEEAK